jgi:glycosyltransferase involved in cell wall biosynthesis
MGLSLILATVERTEEVERFLTSLDAQIYRDFELIVVDQNPDDRLAPILEPYRERLSLLHLHRPLERGVSKSRNLGLQHVNGDMISFPDDDCWYPPNLLDQAACFLNEHPDIDVVSGHMASGPDAINASHQDPSQGRFLDSALKVIQVPGPWGLFLRTRVAKTVGDFDETLGPGAGTPWGAGEDTDYYLRILKAGFRIYSKLDIFIFHSTVDWYYTQREDLSRTHRYGAGRTRVYRRHRLPLWYFAYEVARSFGGVVLSLLQAKGNKAYWHWGALSGKFRGWFSS